MLSEIYLLKFFPSPHHPSLAFCLAAVKTADNASLSWVVLLPSTSDTRPLSDWRYKIRDCQKANSQELFDAANRTAALQERKAHLLDVLEKLCNVCSRCLVKGRFISPDTLAMKKVVVLQATKQMATSNNVLSNKNDRYA